MAANNTVEAVLRSKFEDGVQKGIQQTESVLKRALANMTSASASTAATFGTAWESAIGGIEKYSEHLRGAAGSSESHFGMIGLAAGGMALLVAAGCLKAAHAVAEFVFDLAKEASQALEAKLAFESLTKAMGENADLVLGKLKAATDGQVSGTKLMQNANRVMQSGVGLSMEMYAKMAESIFHLAKAAGVDGASAMNLLTDSVIRGNARGFQTIGLHLAVRDAVSAMAEATGGSTARLADASKMQAFHNELLVKAEEAASALGPRIVTIEDALRQGENTWKSFIGAVGIAIGRSGTLEEMLKTLSERMLQMKAGREQMDDITLATNRFVMSFLKGVAAVASAVSATLEVLNVFWIAAKGIFTGWVIVVNVALGAIVNAFLLFQRSITKWPFVPKEWKDGVAELEAVSKSLVEALRKNVADMKTLTDTGVGGAAKMLDRLAMSSAGLAGELAHTTEEIVRGTGAHRASAAATGDNAEAMKKLAEQTAKYLDLRKELLQRAGLEGRAALAEVFASWAKIDQELTMKGAEWDRKRAELKVLAVMAYEKTVADQMAKQAAEQEKLADASDAIAKESHMNQARMMAELAKQELDYGQNRLENERLFEQIVLAGAKRREEVRQQEVASAVGAATVIERTIELAGRGKLTPQLGTEALGRLPATIEVLKRKLEELNRMPVLSEGQVEEVIKLQQAIERLNRINWTPFRKAMQQMREEMHTFVAQGVEAWAQFWSSLVQGQEGSGRKLLAAFIGMIGQMLVHIGVILIQSGIAEIALAQTLVGRLMGASVAGGLKAIAVGAIVAAVGGIMQGAAANLAQSNAQASGGAGASTPVQQSSQPQQVQVINVGQVGRSQSAGEASEKRKEPEVIELRLSLEDGVVAKQFVRAVNGNDTRVRVAVRKAAS